MPEPSKYDIGEVFAAAIAEAASIEKAAAVEEDRNWAATTPPITAAQVTAALIGLGNLPYRPGDDWPAKVRAALEAARDAS